MVAVPFLPGFRLRLAGLRVRLTAGRVTATRTATDALGYPSLEAVTVTVPVVILSGAVTVTRCPLNWQSKPLVASTSSSASLGVA